MFLGQAPPTAKWRAGGGVGSATFYFDQGAVQAAPTVTHSLRSGQQTSPEPHDPWVPGPVQKVPGLTGVRQCFASGQQYSVSAAQGDVQAAPGVTQTLVSGQHTSPVPHAASPSEAQLVFVGVRQCLASGQQYSVYLQTVPPPPPPVATRFL